jgi:2-polyprenyl-6-methoxyphenol hydroxylase-like FAD-dependent oxidoreductase
MPAVVIVGGGVAGLMAAIALRPLGYHVQVLERDPVAAPESVAEANSGWIRPTVPQALHSHSFTSLGVGLLRKRAPEVYADLLAAGAWEIDLVTALPAPLRNAAPEAADAELVALACRRRTFDAVLAQTARRLGVTVQHGRAVRGLMLSGTTRPKVAGVRLSGGTVIEADMVIDATGHRAASRHWLTEAGIAVAPDETWASEIACYTRFYRCRGDGLPGPLNRGNAGGGIFGHYMAIVHPGDNGTYSVSIGALPGDPVLTVVRDEAVFTAVLGATPLLAPWVADGAGEPISPVHAITVPDNAVHGVATCRQRPVAGLFPLGDAACVTNPLYGRGISLAIAHAFKLAEVLAGEPEAEGRRSARAADLVESLLVPWVQQAVNDDLERIRRWRAAVHGESQPPLPGGYLGLGTAALASAFDATVWRGLARVLMSLGSPAHFYRDPAMRARIRAVLDGRELPVVSAPGREDLLRVIDEANR